MRLLLIFALLLASATFGPPGNAQAHHDDAQHHSHAAEGHHEHGGPDGTHDSDGAHAVVHVCPGCAVFDQLLVADAGAAHVALPRLPANPLSPRSFHANPIPPPPRLS